MMKIKMLIMVKEILLTKLKGSSEAARHHLLTRGRLECNS